MRHLPSARTSYSLWRVWGVALIVLLYVGSAKLIPAQELSEGVVELSIPEEMELKALVDAVSRETGMKIVYDDKIATKKITVRSPGKISVTSLDALLQSTLRMHGLAVVDSEARGWKVIIDASQKQRMFELGKDHKAGEPTTSPDAPILSQIFELEYADPKEVETAVSGLLSSQGGNAIVLPGQRTIIITDFANIVTRVAGLIKLMDRPRHLGRVEFITVEHVDASELAEQITSILNAKGSSSSDNTPSSTNRMTITPDLRSNRLIVVGDSDIVEMVQGLVLKLDVSLGLVTEVYSPQALSVARLDSLASKIATSAGAEKKYQGIVDTDGNVLIVSTTPEVHKQITSLIQRLDGPQAAQRSSRIKFYKLKHIIAPEALKTIRGIQGQDQGNGEAVDNDLDGRFRIGEGQLISGPNRPQFQPQQPGQDLPEPPGVRPDERDLPQAAERTGNAENRAARRDHQITLASHAEVAIEQANISADVKTNSLIVVADPEVQEIYSELISKLDQPQPQVLIEAKVVILDTSDNFALGVEISGGDRIGAKKLFAFSSYGLSKVNPVNGALEIIPGVGFNGTLVNPDVADVVLRAFTQHKRAKVVSSPRVLVSDNAKGLLSSVSEVPFTSVNASQTVSTTSFAGFAQAGTTIEVTPHISEAERLQLKYRITRNDFTGTGTAGVPPPRQTDEIVSEVVIPDGHTLIVGGLNRTSASESLDSFPFLENIPVIRKLVSNETFNGKQTSLFIFLKPVILRDDKFADLKYYSDRDLQRAIEPGDFPASLPVLLR